MYASLLEIAFNFLLSHMCPAIGILGATVMPHSLFLGSALATQDRVSPSSNTQLCQESIVLAKSTPSLEFSELPASTAERRARTFLEKVGRLVRQIFEVRPMEDGHPKSHLERSNNSLPFIRAHLWHGIVDMVVKTTLNLREAGGEVRLQFFSGLLLAENDAVFEQRDAELFYLWTLQAMRKCAIPLLLYDDDGIRKATEMFLCREVFSRPKPNETISDLLMRTKYKIIRALANEMNRKVIDEHNAAISRSYMQPMISTLHALVTLLNQLLTSDDPVMDSYKHVNDAIIIQQFQEEVNPRLTIWPFEEGTPISTGGEYIEDVYYLSSSLNELADTYEQSDYGSESDEGPDMLEL